MGDPHSPADASPPANRLGRRLAAGCLAGMVLCVVAACIPRAWLEPVGRWIGRPRAITVQTHFRLQIVCGLGAVASGVAGFLLRYHTAGIRQWLLAWQDERRQITWPRLSDHQALVLITLVAALSRAVHLRTPMAWDESYTFLNYARKSLLECLADYESMNNHQLNSCIMHVLYRLFGASEPALRLGVFMAGVLLIPVVYVWALTWTDRLGASLTAALVAVAPAGITYSCDARGYMYLAGAAVCLDLASRRVLSGSAVPRHWAVVGVLSAGVGLWAMPIMLYPLAGTCAAQACLRWRECRL